MPEVNMSDVSDAEAFLETGKVPEKVDAEALVDNNLEQDEETAPESDEEESADSEIADEEEADEESEDEEESEEEEDEESESDEAKAESKPGKWKRLKMRAQEAEAKHQSLERDHGELLEHAEFFVQQNEELRLAMEAMQLESARLRSKLQEYSLDEFNSPAEKRAAELELQNQQLTHQQRRYAEQQQLLQQQQAQAAARQQADQIRGIAAEHGVDPVELYKSHKVVAHTGESLVAVAKRLSSLTGARAARARAEARLSTGKAPKKARKGRSGSAGFSNDADGAEAFLNSLK